MSSPTVRGPWNDGPPPDSSLPDRLPPHNLRAEQSVLGSILLDNSVIPAVRERLGVEDFYRDIHQAAYKAMLDLYAAGKPVDVITFPDELVRLGVFKTLGGDDFLAEIVGAVPHALDAAMYAEIVRDKSLARQIIQVENEGLLDAYSNKYTAEQQLARVRQRHARLEAKFLNWEAPVVEGLPAAREFPLDVLPAELARLATEVGASIPCPPDFTAIPCLAIASGVIGRSVSLRVKDSWFELCNGWFVTVAPPGRAKSPGIDFAQKPIWKIQRELLERYGDEAATAEADRRAKRPVTSPTLGRIKAIDATAESLPPILAENPRGMVVVLDELAHLVNGLNQYKSGGRGNDAQMWLSLWNRAPLMIDRKSNEGRIPVSVPEPFITLVGPMTPSMLGRVASPDGGPRRDDGFFDRFLFGFPSKVRRRWVDASVSHSAETAWDDACRRLWNLPLRESNAGRPRPYWLDLTRDARDCYRDWYDAQWQETEEPDFPADSEGPMAKWTAYALRLCLLLHQVHWAYDPDGPATPAPVEVEMMDRAVRLMEYFRAHYERVIATVTGSKTANPDADEILRWASDRESRDFRQAEVKAVFRRRFATSPENLPEALSWLEERGFIRRIHVPRAPGGGSNPGPRFELHPSFSLATRGGERSSN